LLTFDVGRLLVSVDPDSGDVTSHYLESDAEAPPGLVDAAESDPWWRILGAPLVRVWVGEPTPSGGRGLRLQFRADAEKPRFVTLDPDGPLVWVGLEAAQARSGTH
jgi:hypothetical protein